MSAQAVAGVVQRAIVRRFRQDMAEAVIANSRLAFHQLHESIFTDHLREIRRLGRMRSPQARTRLGDEGGAK